MARKSGKIRPTEAELTILRVLWRRGASTVREVHEDLGGSEETGYTTVLKLLQIMWEKGLVTRDETERAHRYEASVSEEQTQRTLLGDLVDRVFEGSAQQLILRALSERRASPEELAEIRRLLDDLEKGGGR